jgi:hypothetical protein
MHRVEMGRTELGGDFFEQFVKNKNFPLYQFSKNIQFNFLIAFPLLPPQSKQKNYLKQQKHQFCIILPEK